MNEEYYIIENGERRGPYARHTLKMLGVTPDTIIWRPGLADWVKVSDLEEAAEILGADESAFGTYAEQQPSSTGPTNPYYGQQQPPYQQPQQPTYHQPQQPPYQQPAYQQPQSSYQQQGYRQPYGAPTPHTNWLPWAIFGTVLGLCSCIGMIFGIIGIVNANKANTCYMMHDDINGDIANSSAKSMTLVSIILGCIGLIGGIISSFMNVLAFL